MFLAVAFQHTVMLACPEVWLPETLKSLCNPGNKRGDSRGGAAGQLTKQMTGARITFDKVFLFPFSVTLPFS